MRVKWLQDRIVFSITQRKLVSSSSSLSLSFFSVIIRSLNIPGLQKWPRLDGKTMLMMMTLCRKLCLIWLGHQRLISGHKSNSPCQPTIWCLYKVCLKITINVNWSIIIIIMIQIIIFYIWFETNLMQEERKKKLDYNNKACKPRSYTSLKWSHWCRV